MDQLDLIQGFIEESQRTKNLLDLGQLFEKTISGRGFGNFACASSVDPLNPPKHALVITNYPEEWMLRFSDKSYHLIDPIFRTAQSRLTPFFWSDPSWRAQLTHEQVMVLNEAAELGLGDGFSVPIHCTEGFPASCSISYNKQDTDQKDIHAVHMMSIYLHEAGLRIKSTPKSSWLPILNDNQRRVLELVAQGKSDWSISKIIGVSEHTVHYHVRQILKKLCVSTRAQAIVRALFLGEIRFADIGITETDRSGYAHIYKSDNVDGINAR